MKEGLLGRPHIKIQKLDGLEGRPTFERLILERDLKAHDETIIADVVEAGGGFR